MYIGESLGLAEGPGKQQFKLQSDRNAGLDKALLPSYNLSNVRSGGKMCFLQLRAALVSVVCAIVFLSGCAAYYGSIGQASETKVAPDSYRVAFFPTGYISWDLAYRAALLRCAELSIENGYRYFGVLTIENYSSATDFALPGNQSHG